jgi:SAM-dependent methyltransferase
MSKKDFKEMHESQYKDMFDSEDRLWWYRGLREIMSFCVTSYSHMDAYIADIGCGTGRNLLHLKKLGYKNLFGLDLSPKAVEFCKQRGLDNVVVGNAIDTKLKKESQDVVLLMDLIAMLDESQTIDLLAEADRILKNKGILIINTAALPFLFSQHDKVCNVQIRYTYSQLENLLKKTGWKIEVLTYRVFLLFPLVATIKILKNITQKFSKKLESDQGVPIIPINWVLTKIMLIENMLLKFKIKFPIGSSLFVVCTKNVI